MRDDGFLATFFPKEEIEKTAILRDGFSVMRFYYFSIFLKVFLVDACTKYSYVRREQPAWLLEYLPENPEVFYKNFYRRIKKSKRPFDYKLSIFYAWAMYSSSAELSLILRPYGLNRKRYDRLVARYPMLPANPGIFSDWPGNYGYSEKESWDLFLGINKEPTVINSSDLNVELSMKEILKAIASNPASYSDLFKQ